MKYQRSVEGGRQYKLFVAEDNALERAAEILYDLGDFIRNDEAIQLAGQIRAYRGIEYRECPRSSGVVDEPG